MSARTWTFPLAPSPTFQAMQGSVNLQTNAEVCRIQLVRPMKLLTQLEAGHSLVETVERVRR
jgi:hypothetical protein